MAEINAKDVMKLRQKTGLPMMDCKEALEKNAGNAGRAEEWLREKLKGKMDTRTERATAEGRVAVAVQGSKAAIIEVQTESDFTARNADFVSMVDFIAKEALKLPTGSVKPDQSMTSQLDAVRIKTGENMKFARGEKLEGGRFGSYIHHDNKRGALVQVEGDADDETLKGICQHIVAHVPPPVAVSEQDMDKATLDRVRSDAQAEAQASGKPPQIAEKIAQGKVRKFLEENTLLDQRYIRDDTKPVKEILPKGVTVKRFVRYTVGA
jgi:elongation factor Ts